MSYKVLARKWRPQHFRDMLGQEPVLRALINALDSNRLHHAYLFTGMRGVGKTTIARIFAKCLNCETNGVSSDPCGTCSTCQDIDAGRFFDLIEVDAASRTKVESTRELLENVPYAPTSGRYKVYLIDEVHMFSTHSFNALLKTLEEPPEHVKFLLATTDPQKVPATVLSRCLQFNLKRMSPGLLTDYLGKILDKEEIKFELPALDLIARASEGSVRDSLSLVEQAASSGAGAVMADEVEAMLGRASVDRLLGLLETLAAGDMPALFAQVNELAQYAPEFSELLGELLTLLHQIAMQQTVPDSISESVPGYERLLALSSSMEADVVQMFYQIGLHARRDMPFAPDTREVFDMALLRMHAFRPAPEAQVSAQTASAGLASTSVAGGSEPASPTTDALAVAVSGTGATASDTATGHTTHSTSPQPDKKSGLQVRGNVQAGGDNAVSARAQALAAALGEPITTDTTEIPARGVAAEVAPGQARQSETSGGTRKAPQNGPQAGEPGSDSQKASESSEPESVSPGSPESAIDKTAITTEQWPQLVSELDIAGMPMQLASNCVWCGINNDQVSLQMEEGAGHLNTPRFIERLESALSKWFGSPVRITLSLVSETLDTPAKVAERQAASNLAAAHDSIKLDPIVRQLIDQVDGAVDESSIRPLE